MRALIALSIIQTGILLILLGYHAFDDEATETVTQAEPGLTSSQYVSDPLPHDNSPEAFFANEEQLRAIIRDELRAHVENRPQNGDQVDTAAPPTLAELAEYDRRRDEVAQQLVYFTSIGRISDGEMQQLQADIAKLDPAGRKEMLRQLTQALNSGQIEGRL